MAERGILDGLVDPKVESVLKLFFQHKDELFHINKISERANVPLATTFRIVKKLVILDIIRTLEVGKFKVYQLKLNEKTELLMGLIR